MAKFERYDARDDARFFDGGEIEDEDEEGSRLPLLLVIGLLVVAAFAGVVWLAYTQGVQRGRADAPRMLVAAGGPVKEAPANPGGSETPYTGLKIYEQPAPQDEDTEAAPQPPTPKATQQAKTAETAPASSAEAKAASEPNIEALPVAPAATKPPRVMHAPASANSIPALKPSTVAQKVEPPAKPVQTEASQPATPATAIAPAATQSAGTVALQIGAYKSEAEANASWSAFSRRHPMVGAYQNEVRKVDLGDKGVWYRLRLGSFADKTEAIAFCDKLKADGGTCFLAR